MIKTEFMELYEELDKLNTTLNERWYNLPEYECRLWFSDSEVQFRNFMKNISSSGMKGVRLVVAPDFYLVANASDIDHFTMETAAAEELYLDVPNNLEKTTCGIPKCTDYELGNYEIEFLKQEAQENPDDEDLAMYLNYDSEKEYQGMLVADYGTFELSLYAFKSKTCPEYVPVSQDFDYYEDSETYRVLKPLLKRIYIYGK